MSMGRTDFVFFREFTICMATPQIVKTMICGVGNKLPGNNVDLLYMHSNTIE